MKLLVDYDGVILKNDSLTKYQLNKSAMFLQKHTNLSLKNCEILNKKYYPQYGHTVTVLNKMFKKPVTLEEYNDYVFNKNELKNISIEMFNYTKQRTKSFKELFEHCDKKDVEWYIFTNAHLNWVIHFSEMCELPIDETKIIWPQNLDLLKPKQESYDNIERMFPNETYIFIDDSEVNLQIPKTRSNWLPIIYN